MVSKGQNPEGLFESSEQLPLTKFFNAQVLPYLDETNREFYFDLKKLGAPNMDFMREDYDRFLNYDPASDEGKGFYDILVTTIQLSAAEKYITFKNVEETFKEKITEYANLLYRNAFFRNSYESLSAWQACKDFARYKELFYALGVLPEDAVERIRSMSKELNELWSRPEVEKELRRAMGDEHISEGGGKGDMVYGILTEDREPLSEKNFNHMKAKYPNHFFEISYKEYLDSFNNPGHPFVLNI